MCSLRFRGNLRRELYRTIFGIKATDHLITLFRPIIRDERSGTSLHASRETVELISSGIAFREYLNVKYGVVELEDTNLRVRIKNVAIEHFNKNGYHGTTIRNIAREVNCSLPMIYYYYKSKKDLFDEIVTNDYLLLLKMLAENVNKADPIEF